MSVLEKINSPSDLHIIKKELLSELAVDIRNEIIQTVSQNGGHIASSLGTVELTIALHYVFNMPADKIVWDVGHQAYAHKILTGRRDTFSTLRTHGGISGFPRMEESKYDSFGVGHSSTAISAALGFAIARDLKNESHKVVAVIGDGSMTGGLSFEGLQNAGHLGSDMLVILNDNQMFISHRVGAVAGYLTKLMTAGMLKKFEQKVEKFFKRMHFWGASVLRVAKRFKVLLFPGMLFEEMGFSYLGPIDGHNTNDIIEILSKIRDLKGPVLLHVITKKGKGYVPAENNPTRFHGIGRFNVITGESDVAPALPSFTEIFSQTLIRLAKEDARIVTVSAAMPEGTGVDDFAVAFPKRFFDVGIAEGHAVTFAAGLAAGGMKPICAIYSTFLQRGFDQIIHDVALQKLPVVFAIDRAGLVGEDGATHHGSFDLSYLRLIPNMTIMSPADENELQHMLKTAFTINGPVAIRYPRGASFGISMDKELKSLPVGKAVVLREGEDVCLLAIGTAVKAALAAADILASKNIRAGVVNMRFLKPIDESLIKTIASKTKKFITIEENTCVGGLFGAVTEIVAHSNVSVYPIALPDAFVEHGSQMILRGKYCLDADTMAAAIMKCL
ncbi:MAG: 1-deoxy-D-xylulose-5-phosphate synthase [Elusimicrobia bacterium]|nr:1-deoxy-D-xylulose-5-phosphate synthase [Elusimicrobiota bacterium]